MVHKAGRRVRGDQIGDEALVPWSVLARDDRDLADGGVLCDTGFDLSQFDAVSADLDLMIDATKKFDTPVCSEAHQITSAVKARPSLAAERVGDKFLGRQLGLVQIFPCQPIATDVQLTVRTNRNRLHVTIQNVHPRVADRAANRNRLLDAALRRHDVAAGEGGVLGRTVPIDEPIVSEHLEHSAHMGNRQRLSSCQQLAHASQTLDLLIDHLMKQRGREPKRRHPAFLNDPPQLFQRRQPRGTHHQLGAVEQAAPEFQGGRIERDRRKLQEHLLRA